MDQMHSEEKMKTLATNEMQWDFRGSKSIASMHVLLEYLTDKGYTDFYTPEEVTLYFTDEAGTL